MKNFCKILILILIAIPTIVFADGLQLEYIEPSYNTDQLTYINNAEKPLVFDFTFTPISKDMVYKLKLTNTTTKALYMTDVDHTTDPNVIISYDGIKKADVLQPGEAKNVNIKFEMKSYPATEYSNQVTFYFKYDLAENHVQNNENPTDPNRRSSNSITDNPATGVLNVAVIVVPFIIVLSVAYLLINKKDRIFKTFIILLVPITAGIVISNVTAEKTEGTVVISGNVKFEKAVRDPSVPDDPDDPGDEPNPDDPNPGEPEEPIRPNPPRPHLYGIYYVEIDPNGGTYNNSPNVFKANYLKDSIVDLSSIDRLYYKFINWTYNGEEKTFANNELKVTEKSILKANWEYGPYFKVEIDPNGGTYKGSTKPFVTKLKEGESLDVETVSRDGYVFYKWEETSSTSAFQDGKIKMSKRDVRLQARWSGIYTLTFDTNADDALCGMVSKEVTNMFEIGTLPTPTREGYEFEGWFINNNKIEPTTIFTQDKDTTAVAHWIAKTDIKYTVNHWKQKPLKNADLKPESYTLEKTETFEGVTDSEITPEVLTIAGYEKPEKIKTTILGNGKRVIDYYYYVKRFDITVTLPEFGIKEVKYKINGSDEYKSLTKSDTLKVEFNSRYDLYAVAAPGYYHYSTGPTRTFNGTMSEATITFAPTVETCPAGHKCEEGSQEPEQCPAGTYAELGSGECKRCAGGSHASNAGSDHCDICLAGTACEEGSVNPTTCPPGTISSANGATTCTACSVGTYANLPGSTSCTDCPIGNKCSKPNPQPTPSPAVPEVGPTGPEQCPAGTYAGVKSGECNKCPAGSYSSSAGSESCTKCPAGHKCEEGSTKPTACPAGTYALEGSGTCSPCAAGYYNNSTAADHCNICPVGTQCPTGSTNPEQCPAGTYGDRQGMGSCSACPAGYHASNKGSTSCDICPAGTSCSGRTVDPTSCSPGTYAPYSGSASCSSCPGGTYSSSSGSISCSTCPAGSKCEGGSTSPTRCPGGSYQPSAGKSSCITCPAGYACPTGSTSPSPCGTGYTSGSGSSYCWGIAYTVNIRPYDSNARNFATASVETLTVRYNNNNSFVLTPRVGYYITSIECTNSYTSTYTETYLGNNVSTSDYKSTVTVYNPGVTDGSTCYYHISQITASMINYSSSYTSCKNVQCALDELYNKLK